MLLKHLLVVLTFEFMVTSVLAQDMGLTDAGFLATKEVIVGVQNYQHEIILSPFFEDIHEAGIDLEVSEEFSYPSRVLKKGNDVRYTICGLILDLVDIITSCKAYVLHDFRLNYLDTFLLRCQEQI